MEGKIIVTYISNARDIKGVLLIKYNLNKIHSKYSFGCIVTENVTQSTITLLNKHKIKVFPVNMKAILSKYNILPEHIDKIINKHLFGKLCVFGLYNYDTVLYLDTDILILNNIDHLLDRAPTIKKLWMVADTQATSDYNSIITVSDRFNSGVIILKPSEDIFNSCFKILCGEGIGFFERDLFVSDQYILEKMNTLNIINIECLELRYNVHPILVESITKYKLMKKIYILHYMVNPKPWSLYDLESEHVFENTTCCKLFKLWFDLYNEMVDAYYFRQTKDTHISGYKKGYYGDNNKLIVDNKLITDLD